MNISASTQITNNLGGLAGRLVTEGILTPEQAQEATREASKMKVSLVRFLTESMDVDSHELAELAAQEFGVPLIDLAAIDRTSLPRKTGTHQSDGEAPRRAPVSTRESPFCRCL